MSRLPARWAMTKPIRPRPVRAMTYLLVNDAITGRTGGRTSTFIHASLLHPGPGPDSAPAHASFLFIGKSAWNPEGKLRGEASPTRGASQPPGSPVTRR